MRLLFLPAVTAILLLADQSAWAQSSRPGCLVNPGIIPTDSIKNAEVHVRSGHPCQINFYSLAGWRLGIHTVEIVVPPAHGTLRTSDKSGGRGIMTYMPQPGFIGQDRFDVFVEFTSFVRATFTRYKVEVTVTR